MVSDRHRTTGTMEQVRASAAELAVAAREVEKAVERLNELAGATAKVAVEVAEGADESTVAAIQKLIAVPQFPYRSLREWVNLSKLDVVARHKRQKLSQLAKVIISQGPDSIPEELVKKVLDGRYNITMASVKWKLVQAAPKLALLVSKFASGAKGESGPEWVLETAGDFDDIEFSGGDEAKGRRMIIMFSSHVIIDTIETFCSSLGHFQDIFGFWGSLGLNTDHVEFDKYVSHLKMTSVRGDVVHPDFCASHRDFLVNAGISRPDLQITGFDYFCRLGNYIYK